MQPQVLKFRRTAAFRREFDALPSKQQIAAKKMFAVFRRDLFDPSLDNHIIRKLTAKYGTTVRAIRIENNLRAVYIQDGNTVLALSIGNHDIYR